eukprot:3239636-Lingulodinium_polyedra.AAC.1
MARFCVAVVVGDVADAARGGGGGGGGVVAFAMRWGGRCPCWPSWAPCVPNLAYPLNETATS